MLKRKVCFALLCLGVKAKKILASWLCMLWSLVPHVITTSHLCLPLHRGCSTSPVKESCGTAPGALTLLDLSSEGELCSSVSDRMRFGLNRLQVLTTSRHSYAHQQVVTSNLQVTADCIPHMTESIPHRDKHRLGFASVDFRLWARAC